MLRSAPLRVQAVALFALAACASGQDTPDAMPVDAHRIDAIPPDAAPPDASQTVGFFLDDSASDFAAGTLDGAFV